MTHTGRVTSSSRTAAVEGGGSAEDVRRCAHGDRDALARLYDRTAPRVYGLALRTLGDPATAQEVTRETYLEVWSQAHRYEPAHGSASAWIAGIAHRRAVERVRAVPAPTVATADIAWGPSHRPAGWAVLSAEQARALQVTYVNGSTCREAAELLDVPPGTIASLLRQGLLRLRNSHAPAA